MKNNTIKRRHFMNESNHTLWNISQEMIELENLINQLQSISLKAPSNASYTIINKISKLPTLISFISKQVIKTIKKINIFKSVPNSFTEKIPIHDPNVNLKSQGLRK